MYHEITTRDRKHQHHMRVLACALVVVLAVVIALAMNAASIGTREQGAAAIRRSILDAAVRCCAIEGSYPLTLKHLEDHYGLRINHKNYIVTYEAYASNIAPSVVVIPR